MPMIILMFAFLLFILLFIFDISFNIRRLISVSEKNWRRLAELSEIINKGKV